MVATLNGLLGFRTDSDCMVTGFSPGAQYTNTRNKEILDKLIKEKVNDVVVLGKLPIIDVLYLKNLTNLDNMNA